MQPRLRFVLVLSALVFALAIGAWADESNVRIVRLSYVTGQVDLDRDGNSGLDTAFLNMPLANGAELVTEDDGYAEVEFESGTAVRLVPRSDVHFRRLALEDGHKVSVLEVVDGTAYFNVRHEGHEEFHVLLNGQDLRVDKSSRFRVVMNQDGAQVSVLSGELELFSGEELKIKKNQTLAFDFRGTGNPFLSDAIETLAYDAWNQEREGYTGRYVSSGSYLGYSSGFSYGWSDLNYFGSFINVAGYGSCWRPYGFDQYWDPYMDGAWVWYPGWGYTWVSGYPWGWAPYRYGRWIFVGGYGWVWQPGHRWNSWYAYSPVFNPPSGYRHHRPPDHPPVYHPPIVAGGGGGHHPGQPGSGDPRPRGHRPPNGDRDDIVVVGRGPFSGNGSGLPGRGGQTGGSGDVSGNVTAGGATNGAQGGGRPLPVAITPGVLPNREAVVEQLRRVHGDDLGVRGNVGLRGRVDAGTTTTTTTTTPVGGTPATGATNAQGQGSAGVTTGSSGVTTGGAGAATGNTGGQRSPQIVVTPGPPQYGSGNVGQQQRDQQPRVTPTPGPLYRPTPPPQPNTTPPPSSSVGSTSTGSSSTGSGSSGGSSAGSGGSSGWHGSASSSGSSAGSSSSGSTYHGGGSTGSTGSTGSSGGSHSSGSSSGSHSSSSSSSSSSRSSGGSHDPK